MAEPDDDARVSHVRVLNCNPPVLHAWWFQRSPFPFIEAVSRGLARTPCLILVSNAWSILSRWKNDWGLEDTARDYRDHRRRHPDHAVIVLANDAAEQQVLQAHGIEALVFQHNGFLHLGEPPPRSPAKDFDAVYIARIEPYKRIELACEIPSCAVVAYDVDRDYCTAIRPRLPHVTFANGDPLSPQFRPLPGGEVAAWCDRARCGLVLSREEGANLASAEYMLRDLPVVTTRSLGGRDEYYDARFWIVCDDDPAAVAAAVAEATSRHYPAGAIRAAFAARVMQRRAQFLPLLLSRTEGWAGSLEPFVRDWLDIATPFLERPRWDTPRALLDNFPG